MGSWRLFLDCILSINYCADSATHWFDSTDTRFAREWLFKFDWDGNGFNRFEIRTKTDEQWNPVYTDSEGSMTEYCADSATHWFDSTDTRFAREWLFKI